MSPSPIAHVSDADSAAVIVAAAAGVDKRLHTVYTQ